MPPGDHWLQDRLGRKANRELVEGALGEIWGEGSRWKIIERKATEQPRPRAEATEEALADPRVQTVLEIFGGSVESVEPVNET